MYQQYHMCMEIKDDRFHEANHVFNCVISEKSSGVI